MRTSERNVRLASVVLLLMLAACSRSDFLPRIGCARGEAPIVAECTVEETKTDRGTVLTLRFPDGGFRRLLVTRDGSDGSDVVTADGAEPAMATMAGHDAIDVRIGDDLYRLPATMRAAR